jgi:hypothetical protein
MTAEPAATSAMIFYFCQQNTASQSQSSQVKRASMSLNDLEFAYAPVRDQVRDLREYL